MELPKNITQIGEVGKNCKIYVEDYVISYMKQLNREAQDRHAAVALYGRYQKEDGVEYHFLYGACKLDFIQREVRHLSQAQLQEIERLRKKYFPEYEFMGYRILDGEMIEGMHLCEQGICRYVAGYAGFYEKNDAMLAYMLDVREQAEPERVDRTKYEEVKKRQDERRVVAGHGEKANQTEDLEEIQPIAWLSGSGSNSANLQKLRLAAVGAFAVLCLLGIAMLQEDEVTGQQAANDSAVTQVVATGGNDASDKDKLLIDEKLEQVLLEEQTLAVEPTTEVAAEPVVEVVAEQIEETVAEPAKEVVAEPVTEVKEPAPEPVVAKPDAVAYIVQSGDTLISISLRQYGSDVRVNEICVLNHITDPDDIKEGQVIMLPL